MGHLDQDQEGSLVWIWKDGTGGYEELLHKYLVSRHTKDQIAVEILDCQASALSITMELHWKLQAIEPFVTESPSRVRFLQLLEELQGSKDTIVYNVHSHSNKEDPSAIPPLDPIEWHLEALTLGQEVYYSKYSNLLWYQDIYAFLYTSMKLDSLNKV